MEETVKTNIEEQEFHQLVAEISAFGFTESWQISRHIVRNNLGYKYKNISGVLEMHRDGKENEMNLTNHAQIRMQQRGIDNTILEYLDEFGCYHEQGNKGSIVFFNKRAKALLRKELSRREFARIERKLNAYYIVSNDSTVITVGHRTKPIRH